MTKSLDIWARIDELNDDRLQIYPYFLPNTDTVKTHILSWRRPKWSRWSTFGKYGDFSTEADRNSCLNLKYKTSSEVKQHRRASNTLKLASKFQSLACWALSTKLTGDGGVCRVASRYCARVPSAIAPTSHILVFATSSSKQFCHCSQSHAVTNLKWHKSPSP